MKKHIAISMIYRFAEKHQLRTDVYADKGQKFISNEQGKSILGFTKEGFWGFSRELALFRKGDLIEPTNGLTYWSCRNNIHTWSCVSRFEFEKLFSEGDEESDRPHNDARFRHIIHVF